MWLCNTTARNDDTGGMPWNLEQRTVTNSGNTRLFALVNRTGGAAYAVSLSGNEIAAIEVLRQRTLLHGPLDVVLNSDDIGLQIDLGTGNPDGAELTVTWSDLPGGQGARHSQTIDLTGY